MSVSLEALKRAPYLAGLTLEALELVASRVIVRRFRKGDVVFLDGQPSEGLYLVASGCVRIYKVSPEGREQVLVMARPGDTFNEAPVFDGGPNPATAEALEPSVLYLLSKEDVLDLATQYPSISRGVLRVFASRLRYLTILVEDLSFRQVRSRVAKVLLAWSEEPPGSGSRRRLTQREIAAMAGSAREVVGRVIKSFEDTGAVQIEHGRIVGVNREHLIDAF